MEPRMHMVLIILSGITGITSHTKFAYTLSSSTDDTNIYPTLNDCFEEGPGLPDKDNNVNYNALQFTGRRKGYIEIRFNPVFDKLPQKWMISFFVFAMNTSGTLFHYRAISMKPHEINEIRLYMNMGIVTASYCFDSNCSFEIIPLNTIPLSEWTLVSVGRHDNAQFRIIVNNDKEYENKDYKDKHKHYLFDLNGKIRLGGSLDSEIGDFIGRLGCLVMRENEHPLKRNDAIKACEEVIPTNKERSCNNGEAKFLWPLNNNTLGYESIWRFKPADETDRNSWSFNSSYPGLQETKAVVFSKTHAMYLFLDVPFYNYHDLFKRFSIAMFVYPVNTQLETLMTISQKIGTSCYKNITVQINTTTLEVAMIESGLTVVKISQPISSTNGWSFISVQYNWYWSELSLIVDSQFSSYTVTQCSSIPDSGSMRIDIGSNSQNIEIGRLVCLAIFSNTLDESTAHDRLITVCGGVKGSFPIPVETDPSPIQVWSLNENSYGYEFKTGSDYSNIPDALCWRFNEKSANLIDSGALIFYGADKFPLTLNPSLVSVHGISIGLFVSPHVNTTGTIIEIQFDSVNNYIITIRFIVNAIKVSVKEANDICSTLSVNVLKTGWFSLIIQSGENGKFDLILDLEKHSLTGNCSVLTPVNYSDIKLGYGSDSSSEDFRGHIRCLSIFNSSLTDKRGKEMLTTACASTNGFTVSETSPMPAVISKWALNHKVTRKQTSNIKHLSSNTSITFDGSNLMHIIVDMPINNRNDYGMGIFLRPSKYTKGSILIVESTNGFPGLKISIESDIIHVEFDLMSEECQSIAFSQIKPEEWHLLMLQRISYCKTLVVNLGNEVSYRSSSCLPTEDMSIRLGGKPYSLYNFRGQLSCLVLFNASVVIKKSIEWMEDWCSNPTSSDFVVEDENYLSMNQSYTHHQKIATDSVPLDISGYLETVIVKSVTHCARICSYTPFCRSFILNKMENSTECTLNNFITIDGLQTTPGSNYYGMVYYKIH